MMGSSTTGSAPHDERTSPTSIARNAGDRFKIVVEGKEETLDMENAGPEFRIANLADAIQGKVGLEITGENGLIALRVSLAAFESIQTGRAVDIASLQG